jgi:hypothetical protein
METIVWRISSAFNPAQEAATVPAMEAVITPAECLSVPVIPDGRVTPATVVLRDITMKMVAAY